MELGRSEQPLLDRRCVLAPGSHCEQELPSISSENSEVLCPGKCGEAGASLKSDWKHRSKQQVTPVLHGGKIFRKMLTGFLCGAEMCLHPPNQTVTRKLENLPFLTTGS